MNLILFTEEELNLTPRAPTTPSRVILARRDERALHLRKVLRKEAGSSFDAGLLGGKLGTGTIVSIGEDGALSVDLKLTEEPPQRPPLRLAIGFPRPIQLRRLLRDLSSLGVRAIDLVGTELGEKSYRDTKLLYDGGAKAALMEGAVQARDTVLPVLSAYDTLGGYLLGAPWSGGGAPLALLAPDNIRPTGAFVALPSLSIEGERELVIAVGSERGWSDRERELLERRGFARVAMGSRALRTETAAVAAAVLGLEKLGALT